MFLEGEMERRQEEEERKLSQMRKRRLERRSSKDEGVVVKGKKEDKYDIDKVLSFVGEGGNNEEKDSRKAKDKKTSKKAEKAKVEVADENSEQISVFEENDSLRSENELLKLDWMRLERENSNLRSSLEACEAGEEIMKEESAKKLMVEKEQCRELAVELDVMRKEKLEMEKKLEMTAELWEREQCFGSKLQRRVDALEEELQRQKDQYLLRERILEQAKEQIKHESIETLKPDIENTKQMKCERDQKLQKVKRHTSAITSRLQVNFKTLELALTLEYEMC